MIEPAGYDPCQVTVESCREDPEDPGAWWFWAHATCVRDALHPELCEQVGYGYEPGHEEPPMGSA